MARHGADAPLWGSTAATFLAARDMWDDAARADGEGSIRAQAILDWRPSTRTRYRCAISQLVETEEQHPELGMQEVLAESLAARSGQGQSASGMRGIFAAVRAPEDLCIIPPTVLLLYHRIAGGAGPSQKAKTTLRPLCCVRFGRQRARTGSASLQPWVCSRGFASTAWGRQRAFDRATWRMPLWCSSAASPNSKGGTDGR